MFFTISENASFIELSPSNSEIELWLTICFPRKHSQVKLRYCTEMDFWSSYLLKCSYSQEDSKESLKSVQYGVLWVSLEGPEGIQGKSTTLCPKLHQSIAENCKGPSGAPKAQGSLWTCPDRPGRKEFLSFLYDAFGKSWVLRSCSYPNNRALRHWTASLILEAHRYLKLELRKLKNCHNE